jgi:hypothetical protein
MPANVVVKMLGGQSESPGGGQGGSPAGGAAAGGGAPGGGAPGGGTGGHAVGGFPHNIVIPSGRKVKKLTVSDQGGQVHLDVELD